MWAAAALLLSACGGEGDSGRTTSASKAPASTETAPAVDEPNPQEEPSAPAASASTAERPLPPVVAETSVRLVDPNGYAGWVDVTWYEPEVADGVQEVYDCAIGLTIDGGPLPRPATLETAALRVVRVDVSFRPETVGGFTWDATRPWYASLALKGTHQLKMSTSEDTTGARWPCSSYSPEKTLDTTYSMAWYGIAEKGPTAPDGNWGTGGDDLSRHVQLTLGPGPECEGLAASGFTVAPAAMCFIYPTALAP
jgi:hypothetical protein